MGIKLIMFIRVLAPMKRMKNISLFVIIILFIKCDYSERFPDEIQTELTPNHFRITGTKLFIKEIDNFKYIPDANVLKYSDNIFIQCLTTNLDFEKDYNNQKFDFYHNTNYEVVFKQKIKINGYNGVYYKLKENNSYWLYFIFGDKKIENRIVGTYPINDNYENDIFNFVKTVYYKNDYIIPPLEGAKFEFNPLNSKFEFWTFSMNSYIFIQKTIDTTIRPNNLFLKQLPAIRDTILLKTTLNNIVNNIQNNGVIVTNLEIKSDLRIDNHFAYTAIIWGEFENKPIYSKLIITSNEELGLLFGINLYNNIESNLLKVDSLINTVKFKEKCNKTGANTI